MVCGKVSEAMRPQWILPGAILLCLNASGCRIAYQTTRNLIFETCLFTDQMHSKIYYCKLANEAWMKYQGEHPDCAGSGDFAKGFKRGYADYLEFGGYCCLPRPQPPLRYLKIKYETPEGRAATVAWQDGFRAGETAAKASGYRELIVVPVGKTGSPPIAGPATPPVVPPTLDGASVPGTISAPVEELPEPRSLPDRPPTPPPAATEKK